MTQEPTQKKTTPTKKTTKPGATVALEGKIYNTSGKEVGTIALPKEVFGVSWNPDLVHQVVMGMEANARAGRGRAHTKDRSEVRGGGKKPWRQKGTGRARHGSTRSPIWVGGGVTHGPRVEKDYSVTIPKKMRVKALYSVLSRKLRDNEILLVDALSFGDKPKTKDAKAVLGALAGVSGFDKLNTKKKNTALVALPNNDMTVKRSFNNIGTVLVEEIRNINPVTLLSYTYLVIVNPQESLATLSARTKKQTK